jgi:hypothetical protein
MMICVSLHDEETGQRAAYGRIRHLADANLDSTSLSLFNGRWKGDEIFVSGKMKRINFVKFRNLSYFVVTGESLRLPSPVEISSFAFTGNKPWRLTLSSGETFCIPSNNDPFEMGLAFDDVDEPIKVIEAREGCESNDETKLKLNTKNIFTTLDPQIPEGILMKMHKY